MPLPDENSYSACSRFCSAVRATSHAMVAPRLWPKMRRAYPDKGADLWQGFRSRHAWFSVAASYAPHHDFLDHFLTSNKWLRSSKDTTVATHMFVVQNLGEDATEGDFRVRLRRGEVASAFEHRCTLPVGEHGTTRYNAPMRLVQLNGPGGRRIALVEEPRLRVIRDFPSIYDLAQACLDAGQRVSQLIANRLSV